LRHLDEVLALLYGAGLSLKLSKCNFFRDTVSYLGHVIHPGKLEVAVKNTEALKGAKPPTNQTQLRSFLGLCNVYRRFVPGFSKISGPLNALLRKGESPNFGMLNEEQLQSFNYLREKLLHPPVLALPKRDGKFNLDTDASGDQIGCCLFQEQLDGTHPIGYWCRSLNPAERNYSTTEKEFLAIVWDILQLRPYFEGQKFLIRTDHHSLRWVLNLADAQGRLARWRLRLLEFDFDVAYSPGKGHHAADTLSRLPPPPPLVPELPLDTEIPCFTVQDESEPGLLQVEDLIESQQADQQCLEARDGFITSTGIEYDYQGVLGQVLPSGEFSVMFPASGPTENNVALVSELPFPTSLARGDARRLRRGDVSPVLSMA
jgi:hypothetical protein